MTPTRAETAINHATQEDLGGARIFYRGEGGLPQFRATPCEGGYYMETALAGGRYWEPRAWMLTDSGLNADAIPMAVWDNRKQYAAEQAEAFAILAEAKIDPTTPVADYQDRPDVSDEVRAAAATLRRLRYVLVWPADVVAEHIAAYQKQWAEA